MRSAGQALLASLIALSATAETTFDQFIQARTAEHAKEVAAAQTQVALSSRSAEKQLDTPAMSGNSTSVLDTSSASDLVAVALNLANLTASTADDQDAREADSVSATVTAYALLAAARGIDPLDHEEYCRTPNVWARRLSGMLGFDDEEAESMPAAGGAPAPAPARDDRVILYGGKLTLWSQRDPCHEEAFAEIQKGLSPAGLAHTDIADAVEERLFELEHPQVTMLTPGNEPTPEYLDFLVALDDEVRRAAILEKHPNAVDAVLAEADVTPIVELDASIHETIRDFQNQQQWGVSFSAKDRKRGADEYQATLILDWGPVPGLDLTVNGAYAYKDGDDSGNGGSVAAQAEWTPSQRVRLQGRSPLRLALAGNAKWQEGEKSAYVGQLKVTVPVLDGIELPVSLSVANRSELVDETDVRGLIGFSFDTTRLLALLQ